MSLQQFCSCSSAEEVVQSSHSVPERS